MVISLSYPGYGLKTRSLPLWVRRLIFYYPLTLSGTILFAATIVVLGRLPATGNAYGGILSLMAITLLLVLSIGGRIQVARYSQCRLQWDSSRPLYAGAGVIEQRVWLAGMNPSAFYRLHFRISGNMEVGRNAWMHLSRETSSRGDEPLILTLSFPLAGVVHAKGSLKLKDIFGLTRARFGSDERRELTVQPAPFEGIGLSTLEAVGGLENSQRQKRSDEERYYMREYIPGDRFRDINWKASSRLSQLITRVSPHTQEKTRLISIEFRHFRSMRRESVESIAHLNQLKSLLVSFLRRVKRDHPEYQFLVKTGGGTRRLASDEDIDRFSFDLSGMFFEPEPPVEQTEPGASEVYLFSTPYDEHVHDILMRYYKAKTRIFRTAAPKEGDGEGRTVRLLTFPRTMPLPGPWVLCRDWKLPNPEIGGDYEVTTEEYPIRVRLI